MVEEQSEPLLIRWPEVKLLLKLIVETIVIVVFVEWRNVKAADACIRTPKKQTSEERVIKHSGRTASASYSACSDPTERKRRAVSYFRTIEHGEITQLDKILMDKTNK